MIYILDNDGCEEHGIGLDVTFVESDYPEPEAVCALLVARDGSYYRDRYRVLAVLTDIPWRIREVVLLHEIVGVHAFFVSGFASVHEPICAVIPSPPKCVPDPDVREGLRRSLFEETPLLLLAHLLDRWPVTLENAPHREALCRAIDERASRTEKTG